MNRENLLKLADYLEGQPKVAFDMRRYSEFNDGFCEPGANETTCGTVGCAVGHAPYAGIEKTLGETWRQFSKRVFGVVDDEHFFLFHGHWSFHRNTPKETAQRIRHFVKYGIPAGWNRHSDNSFKWEPPVEQPTKQEPKVIYKTVVIDKEVVKLQTELHDN